MGQTGADLGLRSDSIRDRQQLQWGAQGAVQAGDAALGELHLHPVCRADGGTPELDRVHRAALRLLLLRGKARERTPGHLYREELRQVWDRGARAGARGGLLARAHPTGQVGTPVYPNCG